MPLYCLRSDIIFLREGKCRSEFHRDMPTSKLRLTDMVRYMKRYFFALRSFLKYLSFIRIVRISLPSNSWSHS
jgi:hypothetical protein